MSKKIEFVQEVGPDGSIQLKKKAKQTTLFGKDDWRLFFNNLEKIPIKPNKDAKKTLSLGQFNGIDFTLYLWKGQYWMLRKDLEKFHTTLRQRFFDLMREKVSELGCYWLEDGIDFKEVDRAIFYDSIRVTKYDAKKTGGSLILLSVEGILKIVSRSTKTKVLLFWLIKKFMSYQLLKFQIESFWEKLQKTESPPELYYLCAAARELNIEKLVPQKIIGSFRGDLVIDDLFLVMIKGYKYHSGREKTYEDTKRERAIQREGYICIEFWAYEVFENVQNCVNETLQIINKFKNYQKSKQ